MFGLQLHFREERERVCEWDRRGEEERWERGKVDWKVKKTETAFD